MVIGEKGLSEKTLRIMSSARGEPGWLLDARLNAFARFNTSPMPESNGDLSAIDFDAIGLAEVDADLQPGGPVRRDRQAAGDNPGEKAGGESEQVFTRNNDELQRRGVIFCDMHTAVRDHPELVRPYLAGIASEADSKFAALNSSAWTGGSFVYVPPGVEVEMPLQAYFRTSSERMGQFERNLIIAEAGSTVHYIEGCSAPIYTAEPLHTSMIDVVVKPGANVSYTAIQNWSDNVFNLVTKRAVVEAEGTMEWIDGNIGSRLTVQRPEVHLVGPKAAGAVLSVAYAGGGQHQDVGATMVHAAPETTSSVVSRTIAGDGGRADFTGLLRTAEGAYGCRSTARRDALLLDDDSVANDHPAMEIASSAIDTDQLATSSEIAAERLFYLMSRGLSESQAVGTVVNGFVGPVTRRLPLEYAVEWSRLIELQIEGSIG